MEILGFEEVDKTFSNKTKVSDKTKVNLVLSLIDAGLELKDSSSLDEFKGNQGEQHKKFLEKISTKEPEDRDKAIISALLNKYKNLFTNEAQQRDFRNHIENLLKDDSLTDQSLVYLLERLITKTRKPKPETPETPEGPGEGEETPEGENPEGESPEGGETEEPVKDTENSDLDGDLDFYAEWADEFNDTEIDFEESDFEDLLDTEEIESMIGSYDRKYSTAEDFIKDRLYSDRSYTAEMWMEDKYMDRLFSIQDSAMRYWKDNTTSVGALSGIVLTLASNRKTIQNKILASRYKTDIDRLEQEFTMGLSHDSQEAYDKLKSLMSNGANERALDAYYSKYRGLFTPEQRADLRVIMSLYVEAKKGDRKSWMSLVADLGWNAFRGAVAANVIERVRSNFLVNPR